MGVTKMKLTVLLVLALAAIATATPFHRAIGLKGPVEPRCDGPECPGGCCPEPAYICCDNGYFCAATEADCPPIKKEEVKQDCPGTECPGGCCPNAGWFCCPGDEYCAASEEYCKKVSIAEKLISMAAPKKIVPELNAQGDVAQMLDGSVVLEMNIVLLVKNTARKPTSLKNSFPWLHPKKLLNKIAPELNAQVDVVPMLDGSVVLEMNTAQQVKNTARKPTLLKF